MSEGVIFVLIGSGMILFFILLFVGAIVLHRRIMASRERGYRELAIEHGLTYIGTSDSFLTPYHHLQTLKDSGFASWANELISGEMRGVQVHLFGATCSTSGGGSSGRFVHYTMCLIEQRDIEEFTVSFEYNDQADVLPEHSRQERSVQQAQQQWNRVNKEELRVEAKKGVLLLSIRKRLSVSQSAELLRVVQPIINSLYK